jgi:uncharacterized iron-regulated membrane protein
MGRQIWVRVHRYVGLATALFLLIAGATGALLAYLEPLSAWISPELHAAPGRGAVLSATELLEHAQRAEPRARIDGFRLHLHEGEGVAYGLRARSDPATGEAFELGYDTLWLDPVTGAVLGRVDSDALPPTRHNLMDFIYRLHYALAIPGNWGGWIMGVAALLWFFDCFVGAWLTWPRRAPHLRKWRGAWSIKPSRFNYDLHRAAGLWLWGLLAALALSSVYLNLQREVFMPVFGLIAETTPEPFETRAERPVEARVPPAISAERAMAIAADTASALQWTGTATHLRHRDALGVYQVYYEKPRAQWATAGGYAVFLDDQTGEVIHVRAPGGTGGDVFLDWIVALHLGTVFGEPYRLLLCLTGLAVAALSITGTIIWWRKRRAVPSRVRLTRLKALPRSPEVPRQTAVSGSPALPRSPAWSRGRLAR